MKYTEGGKNYIEAEVFAENQNGEKAIIRTTVAELPIKSALWIQELPIIKFRWAMLNFANS